MKKSTLITTIAMIVVVVVALSTATYAWFTSAGQTYATQTITTTANATLTVVTNETILDETTDTASFAAQNLLPKTFDDGDSEVLTNGLRNGLWAPVTSAALDGRAADNTITPATTAVVPFIQGTQNKAGTEFTVTKGATAMSPDLIRVSNNLATSQTVTLTIYVGAAATANSYQAGRGVSFYITTYDGTSTATFNSEYSYLVSNASGITDSSTEAGGVISINNTYFTKVNDSDAAARKASTTTYMTLGQNHNASPATPATGYTAKVANDDYSKAGGAKAYYYAITINLGTWTEGQSKNIYLYNWLDGAFLTDSAASADIDICYMFAGDGSL